MKAKMSIDWPASLNYTKAITYYALSDFNIFMTALCADILDISQLYVPVETGELKASGYWRSTGGSYEVGYTAEYAGYVHELVGNYHETPTRAKFLQEAFFRAMYEYMAKYGEPNIPDFDVMMYVYKGAGVKLIMTPNFGEGERRSLSWRRFLGK